MTLAAHSRLIQLFVLLVEIGSLIFEIFSVRG